MRENKGQKFKLEGAWNNEDKRRMIYLFIYFSINIFYWTWIIKIIIISTYNQYFF
jgi:hypothetical protein